MAVGLGNEMIEYFWQGITADQQYLRRYALDCESSLHAV